ncbi:MAG: GNAT family N-acetyltransferase, partial [Rhodobacteraceae bacterium]|nr:GNAT family N-acetyltransferase [Paracoccaceae bacterium]
ALAARGYGACDPSALYGAPVAAVALAAADEAAIHCEGPLAIMAEIWAAGGIGPARLAVMARAAEPRVWLLGRLGQRPVACAFAAVHGEVAVLHALEVAAEARRRGMGALLTRAAAAWAQAHGATTLALAVTESNAPALALYSGLGFGEIGRYHYRLAPEVRQDG